MNNKQLAEELFIRFSGSPARDLTMEAAKRLLQMAPEHEFKVPQEAGFLRELAAKWPMDEDELLGPDWNDNYLRGLCTAAADRIEQMAETIAFARKIQAERDAAMAELRSFAEDAAHQFGYHSQHNGRLVLTHGGLSTLEWAFEILGWENPHPDPENECQYEGCHHYASCGTHTKDGYLRVCEHHYAVIRNGVESALSIKKED